MIKEDGEVHVTQTAPRTLSCTYMGSGLASHMYVKWYHVWGTTFFLYGRMIYPNTTHSVTTFIKLTLNVYCENEIKWVEQDQPNLATNNELLTKLFIWWSVQLWWCRDLSCVFTDRSRHFLCLPGDRLQDLQRKDVSFLLERYLLSAVSQPGAWVMLIGCSSPRV